MAYTNAISVYKEMRVTTASQGQLIIMLYDGAVKQLDRGLDLLGANLAGKKDPGKIEQINAAILKAQEIITELMASLDFDRGGEIAKNLLALYVWFNQELLEANIKQDVRRITIVRNLFDELRTAWATIIAKSAAESMDKPVTGINIAG
ncbi:MAG: flagellar export chaperone FliS [Treponema sp.]|nr:flagellar export chaperone FliS [Treponema sp.]